MTAQERQAILKSVPEERQNGDCFQVHLHKLRFTPNCTLVHGAAIGNGPIEGIKHSHCWLEMEKTVADAKFIMVHDCSNGNDITVPAELYYMMGRINRDEVVRYTREEAESLAYKTGHYGPWHKLPDDVL